MKTILVLTDFSINDEYTAHYALKFAQKIEANLLLCNIYTAPPNELKTGRKKWPLGLHEQNSIEDLGALMSRLKTVVDTGEKTDFQPEIDQLSQEGIIADTINGIALSHHITTAIISMHSTKSLTSLFSTDNAWAIIEQADFPLLVIPYQVSFKNYKLIAFATDMSVTDKYVLHAIAGLAKYSDADILITHVADNRSTIRQEETELKEFFNEDAMNENNPAIIYHAIKNSSVATALKELSQDVTVDMLALIKRPPNDSDKIFEINVIRRLANYSAKPLLIFPAKGVMDTLPVF